MVLPEQKAALVELVVVRQEVLMVRVQESERSSVRVQTSDASLSGAAYGFR